jgi:hypothetical protein
VQTEIVERYPKADLKVYAVWFDMIWTDSRSRWPGDILKDPRVVHFWDEDKAVGRWYASHSGHRNVWWDTYLLYGPESRWQENPSQLISMGSTILDARPELKASLLPFVRPAPRHEQKGMKRV